MGDHANLGTAQGRLWAAIVFGLVCAWNVATSVPDLLQPARDLPEFRDLTPISGSLNRVERGSFHSLRLHLENQTFGYHSRAGAAADLERQLCAGCTVTVWAERDEGVSEPWVYQVAVNNQIVRDYRDVENAWIDDTRYAWPGAILGSIGFIGCLIYIIHRAFRRAPTNPRSSRE